MHGERPSFGNPVRRRLVAPNLLPGGSINLQDFGVSRPRRRSQNNNLLFPHIYALLIFLFLALHLAAVQFWVFSLCHPTSRIIISITVFCW